MKDKEKIIWTGKEIYDDINKYGDILDDEEFIQLKKLREVIYFLTNADGKVNAKDLKLKLGLQNGNTK